MNIAQSKDEAEEEALAGKSLRDVDPAKFPPCVKERGTFMASFDLERFHQHPYAETSKDTHGHFRPTRLHYPAFSVAALPFRWMRKDVIFGDAKKQICGLVEDFPLNDADQAYEPTLITETQKVESLRQSILKRAFSGRLVAQDANDEPASVLLEKIRVQREQANIRQTRNNKNNKKEAA